MSKPTIHTNLGYSGQYFKADRSMTDYPVAVKATNGDVYWLRFEDIKSVTYKQLNLTAEEFFKMMQIPINAL